jgi:thioredoxin-related protein
MLIALLLLLGGALQAAPMPPDSIPETSLVYVEGEDTNGKVLARSIGVIVKDGFVALNYHTVAGMAVVKAYLHGNPQTYVSDGYLSVDETKDLIVISVPELKGPAAYIEGITFPADGKAVTMVTNVSNRRFRAIAGVMAGQKEVGGIMMPQIISNGDEDCTNGPLFYNGGVVGFITAGYLDRKFYSYAIIGSDLKRLLNRSFIIKNYNSLRDNRPMKASQFQSQLMDALSSVLWLSITEAERLCLKKPKMVVIYVTTKWAGWGKLQERNFSSKRIIRYLNENFYSVRLDAETADTIPYNKVSYLRNAGSPYHTLAYSLLLGQMEFPSTVFMDEKMNVLMVVPGLMDAQRFEVVLHYFGEKVYNSKLTPQQFETQYLQRKDQ